MERDLPARHGRDDRARGGRGRGGQPGDDPGVEFAGERRRTDGAPWWAWPLTLTDRACCCPARPLVVVVLPPVPWRPYPQELLLCGHHYRTSVGALIAVDAAVYDECGPVFQADCAATLARAA